MRKGEMIMFGTVKVIGYNNLVSAVKEKVKIGNKCIEFRDYFFKGCENGSYNIISIESIKEEMKDIKGGCVHISEEDIDDYIEVSEALIEIFEENDILYRDRVLVYVCW